mmetsp:Transcript_1653/g.5672  ORF Transcript_1653/g.5672 Transcript_1653/m.5672 type:complete len:204 (-) Transcript_1653:102-713(-)
MMNAPVTPKRRGASEVAYPAVGVVGIDVVGSAVFLEEAYDVLVAVGVGDGEGHPRRPAHVCAMDVGAVVDEGPDDFEVAALAGVVEGVASVAVGPHGVGAVVEEELRGGDSAVFAGFVEGRPGTRVHRVDLGAAGEGLAHRRQVVVAHRSVQRGRPGGAAQSRLEGIPHDLLVGGDAAKVRRIAPPRQRHPAIERRHIAGDEE